MNPRLLNVLGASLLTMITPSVFEGANRPDVNERLFNAIHAKSTTAISEAVIDGADLFGARDSKGLSPLLVAYTTGSLDVFEHLLLSHVDPNAPADKSGNSVLEYLTSPNAHPFLQAFIRFGGDINAPLKDLLGRPEPYLITVARLGRVDLCHAAIQAGAKTEVRDSEDRTVLAAAVARESFHTAYFLLKWGVIVPEADLAPGAFDSILGKPPEAGSPYWRAKFVEELERKRAKRQ